MELKAIGVSALSVLLLATSARAEFRHVEIKTLGMD
jgi:hypothetical protein